MVLVGAGTEIVAGAMNNGGGAADDADATASSSVPHSAVLGGGWNGTLPAKFSSNLWKSLLKSEQAKSTRGQTPRRLAIAHELTETVASSYGTG